METCNEEAYLPLSTHELNEIWPLHYVYIVREYLGYKILDVLASQLLSSIYRRLVTFGDGKLEKAFE